MIITRTPLRISLMGGGTDLPAFYERHTGAVLSMTIDKYVYVMLNQKFDGRIRVSYSKTENVDNWHEIQHEIVRETFKLFMLKGVEIASVADVPGEGTGLGSSSAFTVGLVNSMCAYTGIIWSKIQLAEMAFDIESKFCKKSVGKQDHYAATYGGFNLFEFTNDSVYVHPLDLMDEELDMIAGDLMLFWSGLKRNSNDILAGQQEKLHRDEDSIHSAMLYVNLTRQLYEMIKEGDFSAIPNFINNGWEIKRKFYTDISNAYLDKCIMTAINHGAQAGKICGAGGGGFILIIAPRSQHAYIEDNLKLKRLPFKIKAKGSEVIHAEATDVVPG